MAMGRLGLALSAILVAGVTPALSQQSCDSFRAGCQAVCTPGRVATYYGGDPRKCSASCQPRWQECMRTGIWVDLERLSTGWWEPAETW